MSTLKRNTNFLNVQPAAQSITNFFVKEKNGDYVINKPLKENEIIDLAKHVLVSQLQNSAIIANITAAKEYFFLRLANLEREVFSVLFLDNKNQALCCDDLFFGTINKAAVYPREVAKKALQYNASAVIIAHNHISTSATPSLADRQITAQLKEILAVLDVRLLDHIITSQTCTTSFSELGLIQQEEVIK